MKAIFTDFWIFDASAQCWVNYFLKVIVTITCYWCIKVITYFTFYKISKVTCYNYIYFSNVKKLLLCYFHLAAECDINSNNDKIMQKRNRLNTQFVPLMHIVAKSQSISSKNINYETHLFARRSSWRLKCAGVSRFCLGVKICPPGLNNLSTGALDGSAVLYCKNSFCITEKPRYWKLHSELQN